MQGSYSTQKSVYNTILNHIRKIRDTPQNVRGVSFLNYSNDNALEEYLTNIEQVIMNNRYNGDLPIGLGKVSDSNYFSTPHLNVPTGVRKNIISGYKIENKEDFRKVMALSLAYVANGEIDSVLNKEAYICQIIKAIHDYQVEHKMRFSTNEKIAILHNVNLMMGLESYIIISDGKPFCCVESEEVGNAGMKQKCYSIINMEACACAVFKIDGAQQGETRVASQFELSVEKAQEFMDGKMVIGSNGYDPRDFNSKNEAMEDVREKFKRYKEQNPKLVIDVVFEKSFDDYCFKVNSPAIESTQEKNGYEWK